MQTQINHRPCSQGAQSLIYIMWKQSYSDMRRTGVGVFSKGYGNRAGISQFSQRGLGGCCTDDGAMFELGLVGGIRAHQQMVWCCGVGK